MSTITTRRLGALTALAVACALATPTALPSAVPALRSGVLVGVDAHALGDALRAVVAASGRVLARFPLANAAQVSIPADLSLPAGSQLVADSPLRVTGSASTALASTPDIVRATVGAAGAGDADGRGVTVALVDTGVADVPAVRGAVSNLGGGDGYGHGTFLAGVIAGRTPGHLGVATGAKVLDVRVAGDDGATSLSQVLRGLQRVADRRATDPSLRVLNLSLSSGSPLPAPYDPLAQALEALWRSGVVVVVAAGNDGPDKRTISSPGDDPLVLTVGALSDRGTARTGDDELADFSGRGPTALGDSKPDIVAPGVSLLGVRAPGSVIDVANPQARVGDDGFRGTGTSMSAAVVSGVVADLLSVRPELTPDEVKAILGKSAYDGLGSRLLAGDGGVDLTAALKLKTPKLAKVDSSDRWDDFASAWQSGDWAATARAWSRLDDKTQEWAARAWAFAVAMSGGDLDDDAWKARAWSARAWSADVWDGRAWSASEWLGRAWSASSWSDADWAARAWSARAWSASSWSDAEWSARSARAWSASSWSDAEWSARAWSARAWSGRAWSGRAWSGRAWSGRSWSAAEWPSAE